MKFPNKNRINHNHDNYQKKINKILEDLIKSTLSETKMNKYILRLDPVVSTNYSILLDREILVYDEMGGLEQITHRTEKRIKYEVYRSFDGTINRYTSMIYEDEKEIKHTGKSKKIQYRDTVAFERVLPPMAITEPLKLLTGKIILFLNLSTYCFLFSSK